MAKAKPKSKIDDLIEFLEGLVADWQDDTSMQSDAAETQEWIDAIKRLRSGYGKLYKVVEPLEPWRYHDGAFTGDGQWYQCKICGGGSRRVFHISEIRYTDVVHSGGCVVPELGLQLLGTEACEEKP